MNARPDTGAAPAVDATHARLSFLLDLADTLSLLDHPAAIARESAHLVARHLGVDAACFHVAQPRHGESAPLKRGEKRRPSLLDADAFPVLSARLVREHALSIGDIADPDAVPRPEAARLRRANVHAVLCVPVVQGGTLVASLCAFGDAPHAWSAGDVTLLEQAAQRIWSAYAHARAAVARRAGEQRLRLALEAGNMGTFVWYAAQRCGELDAQLALCLGLEAGVPVPLDALLARVDPQDRMRLADALTQASGSGGDGRLRLQVRVRDVDERERWLELAARRALDEGHATQGRLDGVAIDITASKRQQEALRASGEHLARRERELSHAQQLARLASVDIDVSAGLTAARSPEYTHLHGLPAETRDETHADWYARVHPDDRERAERAVFDALVSGAAQYRSEYRIVRPCDGQVRWIRAREEIERDDAGRPLRMVGAHQDVTEQKATEAALHAAAERHQFLVALGDAMRAQESAKAVVAAASRTLGEHLRASRVVYADIDEGAGVAHIQEGWAAEGTTSIPALLRLEDFGGPLLDRLRAGDTIRFDDVGQPPHARADLAALAAIGVHACISVPLRVAGRLVLNLSVHQDAPRAWTAAEVALAETVAERVWAEVKRARAEQHLRASEEKYRTLFDSIDQGFCVIDMVYDDAGEPVDYVFVEANPAFAQQTGLVDAIGKRIRDLAPDHEAFWFEVYGRIARTGRAERFEHRADALGGRWYDVFAFRLGAPEAGRVAILFDDIGLRKRSEAALRASEERFRLMADNAPVMVWVTDADLDCTYLSRSWYEFTGQTPDTGLGFGWLDAVHPDDSARSGAAFRAAHAERAPVRVEYRLRRKDGQYRWAIDSATPWYDADGRFLGYIGSVLDITERKRAETTLRASEERQAFLLRFIDAMRALEEADAIQAEAMRLLGRHLRVSRAQYYEAAGDGERLASRGGYADGVAPHAADVRMQDFGGLVPAALQAGRTLVVPDIDAEPGIDADARMRYAAIGVRAFVAVPLIKAGRLAAVLALHQAAPRAWTGDEVALAQDVAERAWTASQRAQAEDALRESEHRLRAMTESLEDVFYITDLDSNALVYLSPAYERIWGRSVVSLMQNLDAFIDTLHPDDRTIFLRDKAAQARGEAVGAEYRIVRPDGEIRWIYDRSFPMPDGAGRRSAGVAADITARKRAELSLRDSEERLQLALDASGLATWDWDMVHDQVTWSDAHFLMQGYAVGEVEPSFDAWSRRVHPEDLPRAVASLEAARETRSEYACEMRSLSPDGRVRVLSTRGRFFYDADGSPVRMIGVMQDITIERTAEDAVRESEARYRALFESMEEGLCVVDLLADDGGPPTDCRVVEANTAFERLMALPGVVGKRASELGHDDPPRWLDLYARVAKSGQAGRFNARSRNTGRWFSVHAFPVVPGARRVAALFTDVTRSRMAEQVLQKNEQRQALLLAFGDAAKATTDPRLVMAMAARLLGQHLQADRVGYAEVDDSRARYSVIDDWARDGMAGFAGTYPIETTGRRPLALLRQGETFVCDEVHGDPRFTEEERVKYAGVGIGAVIAAPLIRRQRLAATLFVHQATARSWTPDEIDLVREFALRTWAELDRARAEEALRVSEARFRQFGEASSDVLWIRDADTLHREYINPAYEIIYGVPPGAGARTDDWLDLVHPDFRDAVRASMRRVRAGERVQIEFQVCRPDGRMVWVQNTAFPLLDAAGNVQRIAGIGQDITAIKDTEARMQVMIGELQHRTRNLIAVVDALARKTLSESRDLADFAPAFQDRLAALARVQGLLSRLGEGDRVDFDVLVREELAAHGTSGIDERVRLDGPPGIALRSRTVQTLALALHELATNAVKYGALACEQGRLHLQWRLERRGRQRTLHLVWHETGVVRTDLQHARGGGYGRELIERALPYQLKARTRYELRADGVCCTIEVPLADAE